MPLNIIFMGTPDFAVPTLKALYEAGHTIKAAYSQPPRPAGRGHKVVKSPVHDFADAHHIPVHTPTSFKNDEDIKTFQEIDADLAVVVAYGLILPKSILDAPTYGCLNLHFSLLPRWRGAAPVQHAILAGDTQTGVAIMQMDEGLDTGDVVAVKPVELTKKSTSADLYPSMAEIGARMIVELAESPDTLKQKAVPQPNEGITLAPKIKKDMGRIDWTQSADVIDRHIRALSPWPGVWFDYQGNKIKVLSADVIEDDSQQPGTVLDNQLTIACGEKALRLTMVQKPGSKAMPTKNFLNGMPIQAGDILL